jgi:hypothetical protein
MKVIGFGHRKRVGKDMACALLKARLEKEIEDIKVEHASFAKPIYDICRELYGWAGFESKDYYDYHGREKEIVLPEIGKSPRQILIDFGTTAIRTHVFQDTWVKYALRERPYGVDVVLFSDMRFPNEIDAIHDVDGMSIRIDRPKIKKTDDPADVALEGYDKWEVVIDNVGTIQDLDDKIWEATKGYILG